VAAGIKFVKHAFLNSVIVTATECRWKLPFKESENVFFRTQNFRRSLPAKRHYFSFVEGTFFNKH